VCSTYFNEFSSLVAEEKPTCYGFVDERAVKVEFNELWWRRMPPHKMMGGGKGEGPLMSSSDDIRVRILYSAYAFFARIRYISGLKIPFLKNCCIPVFPDAP